MKGYYLKGVGSFILLLSGCTFTPYNTHFECPVEKGVSCTRMSEINRMIDRGDLGEETDKDTKGLSCKGVCLIKSLSKEPRISYFYKKDSESPKEVSGEYKHESTTGGEELIQELPEKKISIQESSIQLPIEEVEI